MCLLLRCRATVLVSILLLSPFRFQSQDATAPPPGIRLNVDRVNVGVTVTDSRGRFIEGLRREDFHVFDNGAEQPLTDFLSIAEPAQLLVLVEAGPAVYFLESGHLRAASALLDGLSPDDRVAIARYDQASQLVLDFTSDKQAATAALDQLQFNLGFGQLNLSSSLAASLDWLARAPGKKAIVLLSTGLDTSSPAISQSLLARLQTTDVRLLAVSLGSELRNARPSGKTRRKKDQPTSDKAEAAAEEFDRADRHLKTLTEATGGRAYFPASTKDFTAVFADIAQLVRHEYSLAFIPPVRDGKIHGIEVRVAPDSASAANLNAPPRYRVEHRQAYRAPAPDKQ
jgi:VWFA-related protein